MESPHAPLRRPLIIAAGAAAMLTLAWRFLTFNGFTNDHYMSVAWGQQVLLGELPIRDFFDPGEMLMYLVSAAGLVVSQTLAAEWTIMAVAFAIGAAVTLVTAARLSGSIAIAAAVMVLEVLIAPRSYSYPKVMLYAIAGSAIVAVAASPSTRRIVLLGAIVAVSFLFRHDHGLYIGAAAAVAVVLAGRLFAVREAAARLARLAATVLVVLLPWIAYVQWNGGLRDYFSVGLEFARVEAEGNVLRSLPTIAPVQGEGIFAMRRPFRPLAEVRWVDGTSDTDRLALEQRYAIDRVGTAGLHYVYYVHDTAEHNLRALADDPRVEDTNGLGRVRQPRWRGVVAWLSPMRLAPGLQSQQNAETWLFWLFWTLPPACVVTALLRWRLGRAASGELAAVTAVAVMTLLANAGFLRNVLGIRLADAIVGPVLLGAWLLGRAWSDGVTSRLLSALARAGSVIVFLITLASIGQVADLAGQMERAGLSNGSIADRAQQVSRLLARSHREAPPSRFSGTLRPFYDYVDRCTTRDDRLMLTSLDPDVLVIAGRGFAAGTLAFFKGYSPRSRQESTIARLQRESVPIVLAPSHTYRDFRSRFSAVADYVERAYTPMTEIPFEESSPIRVLVRRDRVSAGLDPKTGWPCFR